MRRRSSLVIGLELGVLGVGIKIDDSINEKREREGERRLTL
jgi:hypothetical protein